MKKFSLKKITSRRWVLLLTALSVFSMCACSREGNGSAADQETDANAGGAQTESTNGDSYYADTAKLYIVEPPMAIDQTADNTESQDVINTISRLSGSDMAAAVTYAVNRETPFSNDHVVLLCQSETGEASVYGYESDEYGSRGIIFSFNDNYSYYDYVWSRDRGRMNIYQQDFDHDGAAEAAFCFQGAYGTGISTERLVVFDDIEGDGAFAAYEFTPELQLEQFEQNLLFTMDLKEKELIITKESQILKSIDWQKYEDQAVNDTFGIDCLNQIIFEINGEDIKMCTDIGILFNKIGGPTLFFEDGQIYLDIIYSNGVFQIP